MSYLRKNDDVMFNTLLSQGKKYLDIQSEYKYLVDPHLKLIEETSAPNLGSIIENFSQNYPDKLNSVSAQQTALNAQNKNNPYVKISPSSKYIAGGLPLPDSLQTLIAQYNSILKQYQAASENMLRESSNDSDAQIQTAQKLNAQLIQLLNQMNYIVKGELTSDTVGDTAALLGVAETVAGSGQPDVGDQNLNLQARIALNNQFNALNTQRNSYNEQVDILNTLMGENEDVKIRRRSAYYQFLVWGIVSVTLIAYTTKYALSV